MEKMNKSIQLLLLISLVYLGCCSCLVWPGIALTLKQSCFYFLLLFDPSFYCIAAWLSLTLLEYVLFYLKA